MENGPLPAGYENGATIVRLSAWILIATVVLAAGIKFFLSSLAMKTYHPEDLVLLLAVILDIGYVIAISFAAATGIDLQDESYRAQHIHEFEKAIYAGNICLVVAILATQISVIFFLHLVTPMERHRVSLKLLGVFAAAANCSFLFAAAFSCKVPSTWLLLSGTCLDQTVLWTAFDALNIAIELGLVIFPVYLVYGRQWPLVQRLIVITTFGVRIGIVAVYVASIVLLQKEPRSWDTTIRSWQYNLCQLLITSLSIITVCIPYIRNLLVGMQSGMIQTGSVRLGKKNRSGSHVPAEMSSSLG